MTWEAAQATVKYNLGECVYVCTYVCVGACESCRSEIGEL